MLCALVDLERNHVRADSDNLGQTKWVESAVLVTLDVATECCGSAQLDRRNHAALDASEMFVVGTAIAKAMAAEDNRSQGVSYRWSPGQGLDVNTLTLPSGGHRPQHAQKSRVSGFVQSQNRQATNNSAKVVLV